MKKNFLIFDFGASNGRAVVANFDGKKFNMAITHRFDNSPVYATETLYWDILRLYSELKMGIQISVKNYKDISSIGIDAWGADFGIIDKNRKLISNPVHYRDERRKIDSDSLYNIISGEALFELTGALVLPIFDLFQLYSLKKQNAAELLYGYKYLMLPDLFNYFLTGNIFNEYTRATTTIMCNQKDRKWEEIILDKLGIPKNLFSKIIMPGTKIGDISSEICRELEIKPISVIAPATHDTASAVAGIPIIDNRKKWSFISMGTWCIIGKEIKNPILTNDVYKSGFANEAGVEGLNILFKNSTGLWIIQQCRDRWIKDKNKDIAWDEIVKVSSAAEPFKSFIDVDSKVFSMIHIAMTPNLEKAIIPNKDSVIDEIKRYFEV